ncbi:hypothetical protein KR215_003397 [Drosophila sulfurigaster]|nr:hypothetical protein KR215_003397 [Drosophila sulfurigaster]
MERERLMQQQRINESNKQASAAAASSATARDRSPHRSIGSIVGEHNTEIRIKEEHPRSTKEEQDVMLMRASAAAAAGVAVGDPRYHPSSLAAAQAANAAIATAHHHANFMVSTGRHGPPHGLPPSSASHLSRNMMPPTLGVGGPLAHFAPPVPPPWGIDAYRDPYGPILRYNPIMEAAFRHEAEAERQKVLSIYAAQSAAHLRGKEPSPIPPPSMGPLGPPPTHLRMQPPPPSVGLMTSSTAPQPPSQQCQQPQLSTMGMGKAGPGGAPGPPTMNMAVQHMISVDPLKKEPDHTIGIVVSSPGTGISHGAVPTSVIGIPSAASPATPSR